MAEIDTNLVTGAQPLHGRRLRVAMLTSQRERCGIADYSRLLVAELERRVEIAWITDPSGFSAVMNEADIIHVQHQYFLFGGVAPWKNTFGRFADQIKAPAVMTVHEFVEPDGNLARRAAVAAVNRAQFAHRAIRAFITHTEADRGRLEASGVPRERLHVIPLASPTAPALPPRSRARSELGVGDCFVMTIFGFLSRRKGHAIAIKALALLPPNVRLLLAGGRHPDDRTDYEDELRALAASTGVSDRMTLTGYLEDEEVATVMAATDLVLAPFTAGSGSASLAMAFACGKPVVAAAIPANVEINRACPGAVSLVPPNDAAELAAAVSHLLSDSRKLTRLSEGSRRWAAQHTYADMADRTVRVYHSVVGKTAP